MVPRWLMRYDSRRAVVSLDMAANFTPMPFPESVPSPWRCTFPVTLRLSDALPTQNTSSMFEPTG